MNGKFHSFWDRLTRSARKWEPPHPTESEKQRLADNVLRGLRQLAPDPAIWWTPLAKRAALGALVIALLSTGLLRKNPQPDTIGPNQLAAAILAQELKSSN